MLPLLVMAVTFFGVGPISKGQEKELEGLAIADVPSERVKPICGGVLVAAKEKRRKPCLKPV